MLRLHRLWTQLNPKIAGVSNYAPRPRSSIWQGISLCNIRFLPGRLARFAVMTLLTAMGGTAYSGEPAADRELIVSFPNETFIDKQSVFVRIRRKTDRE